MPKNNQKIIRNLAPQKTINMQNFGASKEFIKDDEFEWEVVGEGIKRKIMGYDDKIMMVNVLFEKGSVGTPIFEVFP